MTSALSAGISAIGGMSTNTFGGAGLLGLGSFGLDQLSSAINTNRQVSAQKDLMSHQFNIDRVTKWLAPSDTRKGLEKAGYNPLLAIGQPNATTTSSMSAGLSDSDQGSTALAQALAYKQLQNETNLTSAQANLMGEQAETERSKQINYDFQNSMLDVQKHLADKDLATYERRFYMDMYERMQRAENYRANSAVALYNAQTQRQAMLNNYKLGRDTNDITYYGIIENNKTQRGRKSQNFGAGPLSFGYSAYEDY